MTDTTEAVFGPDELAEVDIAAAVEAINALKNAFAFNSRDWGKDKGDAWHYGIILGWDHEPEFPGDDDGAMDELAKRFHWTPDDVTNLRRQHRGFDAVPRLAEALRSAWAERDQAKAELAERDVTIIEMNKVLTRVEDQRDQAYEALTEIRQWEWDYVHIDHAKRTIRRVLAILRPSREGADRG